MREREIRHRMVVCCGFVLAGLGMGLWLALGEPPRRLAASAVIAAVIAVAAVQLVGDRWGKNALLLWGAGLGFFLTMAGAVWGFYVTSPLFHGVLRFSTAAMKAAMAGWEDVVLLAVPGLGGVGAVVLAISGLLAVLRARREMKGRKKSASELYGKAKFLERRWQRAMTRQKGLMLGKSRDGLVAYRLEGSAMCFAPPRTGKGATIALNYLDPDERGWPGSTVLIDPRGETFPMVARRRRELGRRPILLDPFGVVARHRELEGEGLHLPVWQSEQYNPIDFIRDGPEAVRDISVLTDALMEEPKTDTGNQKHFYESARSLISGYLAWVRFKMPKERRNLRTLHELLALGTEAREELFAAVDATPRFAGGLMHLAVERSRRVGKEEGGSNFTTVSNQLSFLNYPELAEHTRISTFDPLELANGDMDIFVVVPDALLGRVKGWVRLWITIPYAVADRKAFERDMLVVIDELPAVGYLSAVMEAYNLAAGKGVHFLTFAQSVSAIDRSWGQPARETLMDLAEVVQILGWSRLAVSGAEMLSKAIGAATFESRSESRSGQLRDSSLLAEGQGSIQESLSVVKEQLVPVDEILSMGPDDQFVVAAPKDMPRDVIRLKHARHWQMRKVRDLADGNPFVIRKERSLGEAA